MDEDNEFLDEAEPSMVSIAEERRSKLMSECLRDGLPLCIETLRSSRRFDLHSLGGDSPKLVLFGAFVEWRDAEKGLMVG